ncbi:MAG: Asp-tRNA(Asn)/Glu-tRNA(Gln) amidotransferase subunit GatA [Bacteroidetes bacterium]|nr:Asp-tRNA(Asn)/Glu-tRNA(Gln) amidotransferase subunit GatA [Bacteroidota bacterium]
MTFDRIEDLHRALDSGQTTCAALAEDSLRRAAAENPHLNALAEIFNDSARAHAAAVDERRARGDRRALDGVTLVIKDNMVYAGHAAGASSKILTGFVSPYSATAVQRVLDAGAVIIGRANSDEFAMGSSNETSAYGPVRNPLDPSRTPGGSSGGSAAAVAAGWVHAALGSDTGGSIRQPASFCGIFGAKPTYGRVSRYGLIAYASSFDQIGPFARSASDLARITEVLAGADEFDSTCSDRSVPSMTDSGQDPATLRFGYYQEVLDNPALDPELRAAFMAKMDALRTAGHHVEALRFDNLDALVPIYYILTTAEASANLARFDGVRYGYRAEGAKTLEELYRRSRSEGFGTEVQRRILLGTFVLRSGFFDAYYGKAQKARRAVQDATNADLAKVDLLISPTTPHTAFELGRETSDPTVMYLEDVFTVQAPIAGLPALSLPMGLHSNGLPMGLHLTAKAFDEPTLFRAAEYLSS